MSRPSTKPPRVLAVASGGGHWVQLLRLRAAFENCDVAFVTVKKEYQIDVPGHRFHTVNDATLWNKFGLARMLLKMIVILIRVRPDVIVSTGAAPGFFAILLGRWLGARTVWLDSIANVDSLSKSGQKIGKYVDLWLTQWPHLATPNGPEFKGGVL